MDRRNAILKILAAGAVATTGGWTCKKIIDEQTASIELQRGIERRKIESLMNAANNILNPTITAQDIQNAYAYYVFKPHFLDHYVFCPALPPAKAYDKIVSAVINVERSDENFIKALEALGSFAKPSLASTIYREAISARIEKMTDPKLMEKAKQILEAKPKTALINTEPSATLGRC